MTYFKDVMKRILDNGKITYYGQEGYRRFVLPMLELLTYTRELEQRIEKLEKEINSKE